MVINSIENKEVPYWYPAYAMDPNSDRWSDDAYYLRGITHIHQFYFKRNLWILAALYQKISLENHPFLMHAFTGVIQGLTRLQRFRPKSTFPNMILSGTLYIGSLTREWNVPQWFEGKIRGLRRSFKPRQAMPKRPLAVISTQSSTQLTQIPSNSTDYIFTDPPFGSNIIYSDLNFLWESWLKVLTNTTTEAVVHRSKKIDPVTLDGYRDLMTECFSEMYRILKPGRWITVVFHNSKASVWNAIQEALARAGFLVAQVTVMDKQQGSFKQVTAAGAVKNDLVINAYKPRAGFTQKFMAQAGRGLEADFVRQHLEQLPVAANVERSKEMLYSKYLAYYVQHGYQVQYNGEQFYRALAQWGLVDSAGYWFTDESQLEAYIKRQAADETEAAPQPPLFIFDERSAIQWLKHFLHSRPATLSDIQPDYLRALQTSQDQMPDLRVLLAENIGQSDRTGRYHWPHPQLQSELDEARHQRLLRLFNDYFKQAQAGQRLKQGDLRKEALVTGFTEAYREGRFRDILTVGHRLPKSLLEANPDLFDFVDIAAAKVEG